MSNELKVSLSTKPSASPAGEQLTPYIPSSPQNPTRVNYYKIISPPQDFGQYNRTLKAYLKAGMPLEHIANAGEQIGDPVEKGQVDAPILPSQKAAEIREGTGQVMAWQNRGEVVTLRPQLGTSEGLTGTELIITTQELASNQVGQNQSIEVIEGIAIDTAPQELIVDQEVSLAQQAWADMILKKPLNS